MPGPAGARARSIRRAGGLLAALLLVLLALSAPARAQSADTQRTAVLIAQVAALEEEVRRLTGRIEEAEFQNRTMSSRIDKLIADLDARLPPADPATAASGAGADAIARPRDPTAPQPPEAPSVAGVQPLAPGEQELGALPRDVLVPDPGASADPLLFDAPRTGGTAAQRYDAAEDLLKRGDWPAARAALEAWLEEFPTDRLAPTASYWLGETLYVEGDFAGAAAAFARNYSRFGADAPRAPDSLLKAGMALAQLGKNEEACAFYAQLDRLRDRTTTALRQQLARERQAASCS